jgi:hypothetical protein
MAKRLTRRIVVVGLVLAFTSSGLALAQSGRRTAKPKVAPVSTPEPSPAPTPTASAKPAEKPALRLIVGMDRYRGFVFHDIQNACADRLDDNRSVQVIIDRNGMTRGDAIRRARAETDGYVVWLDLRTDSMSGDLDSGGNYVLEYSVFAPETAKLATSGRTYPQAFRNRSVILNPRTSGIYGDYQLQQAARQAADRILSALKHPLPPKTIPLPSS